MILYALVCGDGHRFESWFRDSAAFDERKAGTLLSCPVCGSTTVVKTIMAPAVVSPQMRQETVENVGVSQTDDGKSCEARNAIRRLRAHLLSTGDDVGPRFATEARRIHDGDAPDRQIYGQASAAETRDLLDDGILVLPLPADPDAMN